jgi:hypothetical protein
MMGTTAAYAAAMTPTLAGSKPISVRNSFSTGTQSRNPCSNTAMYSGRSRRCSEVLDRRMVGAVMSAPHRCRARACDVER